MLVGIHQPHYLPWLRYFEKIARCDAFIVLDTVDFSKNGWQNRNCIKTANGAALLTVPVHAKLGQRLDAVGVCGGRWPKKHWRSIKQAYSAAPCFSDYAEELSAFYERPWKRLAQLNNTMLGWFLDALGIATPVHYASELDVSGEATERLVNLVKAVGGDRYYSGAYAVETYLDAAAFEQAGIGVELQDWTPPVYPQLHGPFMPDLSIVDLLMNCGPDSLEVLLGAR